MKIAETEWIWKNGSFIKWHDAQVHLLSHSLQFGSAIFEGIRAYETARGPAIFRLREHLLRMHNSCRIYRMEHEYSIEQLVEAARETVAKNNVNECYIRPMVVRGYGAAGMVPFESPIEVYIPVWPWGTYLGADALTKGIDACIATWHRMAPNTTPAVAKIAGNYLGGQLIKMEALRNGYDEGIALGPDGLLSEGSGQNVFLVRDGVLYTPPVDGTLLPGITRTSVIALAEEAGVRVVEQMMPREALHTADEVFITGTASEVTPVRSVDRIAVGAGVPGPITLDLQRRYLDAVHGRDNDPRGWLTYCR
jgi:branched-chain amino acid aminotransferase